MRVLRTLLSGVLAGAVVATAGCSTPSGSRTGTQAPSAASTPTSLRSGPTTTTPSSGGRGAATTSRATPTRSAAATGASKLLVVVLENHSLAQMRDQMPFTHGVAQRYGYATAYRGVTHPSLPNYLAIATGSTHGVQDDAGPDRHPLGGATVFGRALAAGSTAAVYAEGMDHPCELTSGGRYAVKHNPWAYFPQERVACADHDLPLSALPAAIDGGTLPAAGMVVPDLCHDAHDCGLDVADSWFRDELARIEAGPDWRSGRLVVVLTADEDDRSAGNLVLTVVAHPALHHVVVRTPLDHYSLARLYAEVTHTAPLGNAADASSMAAAFGLPLAH